MGSTRGLGVKRGRPLAGAFAPPGDKSITHRALCFGLLAAGVTRVRGANPGEDCARSAACGEALGALVERTPGGWELRGTAGTLRAAHADLDCGNSGTTMRLLAGVVAGFPAEGTARSFTTRLTGDASLSRRPMRRIAEPLVRMGAHVHGQGERCTPPLSVTRGALRGIHYDVPMASAQVATCVLLAGLAASGETMVTLPGPARDHTERLLPVFGVAVERSELRGGGRMVRVRGGATLTAADVHVPGDLSAAAFLFAAAAAEPGSRVTARDVNLNPTRTAFLDVLREMGGHVTVERARDESGEPVGDVTVEGPDQLVAFDVPAEWVPRMLDEVPAWVVVASAAAGTSRLSGASELRVKESDRLSTLAQGLGVLGIACEERPDGLEVTGGEARGRGRIATRLDHRIAMAFAAIGCRTREPVWLDDVSHVATSFPGYFDMLAALGAGVVSGARGREKS